MCPIIITFLDSVIICSNALATVLAFTFVLFSISNVLPPINDRERSQVISDLLKTLGMIR